MVFEEIIVQVICMNIPQKELKYFTTIRQLPPKTKMIFGELIYRGSKDGYIVIKKKTKEINDLIAAGLVIENNIYRGKGYSLSILPQAPYLHRGYKRKFQLAGKVVID